MKRHGFTLIELLTVIIILGVVATIAIPNVLKSVRNGKKNALETQLEIIKKSANDWALVNTSCLVDDGDTIITLGRLKYGSKYEDSLNCPDDLGGFVDKNIKNPKTKELFPDDMPIVIRNIENQYIIYVGEENVPEYVDKSGANKPDLLDNMIPIKYDGTNWVYANSNDTWYNYNNKEWANAVVLNTGVTKNVGDTISEDEVSLWYVWIPRYKYQLFNAKNESKPEQEIAIQFESGTETTGTVSCTTASNGVETCTNAENSNWYTHPAFTLGTQQLTGIWVGKFEVSTTDSTCNSSVSSTNCNKELPVTIKPGISSWRSAQVVNFFNSIQKMSNTYSITDGDSHMMKNNEWGVVAYLKQSKYGLGTTDIVINSNSSYVTGGGTGTAYKTEDNVKQSTTGNIYGVYDMSGGSWEYVMGNMVNSSGAFYSSSSGFTDAPDSKYYDSYSYDGSSTTTHARGHLGDATKETLKTFGSGSGGWYSDSAYFPYSSSSWFRRGGYYGNGGDAGVFAFSYNGGDGYSGYSARAVLARR